MNYRKFGKLDWQVSALGFGVMRLPTRGDDWSKVDEREAIRMLRYAIDQGVNYLDSGYFYHGGNSERVIGMALQDGYRDRVKVATKLLCSQINTLEDCDRMLDEQLERLQTDHIDVYLLHGLSGHAHNWPKMRDLGVLRWAEGAIAKGHIGCLGFSFHDHYEVFQEIVDAYDGWAMCQIQHNYMDIENQAGTKGLRYAASKGLAVAIMEPLLGGRLATPPPAVQAIWNSAPIKRTPVEWALHWLWDQVEVSVVLSGMSTIEQIEQNVASVSVSSVGSFTAEDQALIARVRETYKSYRAIPCTQCRYCMPCPNGVDIPTNLYVCNRGIMYDDLSMCRFIYNRAALRLGQAEKCTQCCQCEPNCPQHIAISEWMPVVHAVLGEGKAYDEVPTPVAPLKGAT